MTQHKSLIERNRKIAQLFKEEGWPMSKIGKEFGITRQGVQLILQNYGLSAKDGGAHKRALDKKEEKNQIQRKKRHTYCLKNWGCTLEQYEELRNMDEDFNKTPIARFIQHRSNALRDSASWNLTLWEWWTIWKESGKYELRGRGPRSFCMSRKEYHKPYQVDNVIIKEITDNIYAVIERRKANERLYKRNAKFSKK